ncbi:MAG: MipA/OmpV family protein [Lentisphaeraceae bacterium]|nr:MipA/OmpV family protein [Lentisphaeraceae bacterium]
MKKAIALLLLSVFAFNAQAQDEKAWSVSLDQGIYDKYIWRGLQFNEEGVNQGALDVSYDTGDMGTFGINVWYNLDLDNENGTSGEFSEVDYTVWWEKSFGDFTLGAGHIYYDFSEVDLGSTREIYVSVSYDTFLAPSLTVYYDYEDVDGFYVDFGIGHSFDLGVADMSLDLGANIGWADDDMDNGYYNGDGAGFSNYSLSAAVNIPVGDNVTITPSVMYYSLLGDANSDGTNEDDDFVFGVNVNFSF